MTTHLLAINIGPVQDFIAAARRTRDLWFGSHMLSEVSKAAARAVQIAAGLEALVFPAPENETDLQPTPEGENPKLTVANVILALIPEGEDPCAVATQAETAAKKRWCNFAENARRQVDEKYIRDYIWEDQVDDVIEFYAAWVPMLAGWDYAKSRTRVIRLISARKTCRDFGQPRLDGEKRRLPKSSLDGKRETVLEKGAKPSNRLRLADGEQLDCIGLTKRLAGGVQHYPSVARIAADPWIRRLHDSPNCGESFRQLLAECRRLGSGILSPVKEDHFLKFPYEGTALYINRHPSVGDEAGLQRARLSELTRIVKELTKPPNKGGGGEPDPYLAILAADGDRIGASLSRLNSPEEHRDFSRRLSAFADVARRVIRDARGVCVYAGGDDVLAFVPLDSCLGCARKLRDQFEETLRDPRGGALSLSVGIAVGHFMEPLEDLRAYARDAEVAAKKATPRAPANEQFVERNGLAVHVHPRGGAFFGIRERWQEGDLSLEQRLDRWAMLFQARRLPQKLPYDLRELTFTYKSWSSPDTLASALQADCLRLMRHKQVKLEGEDGEQLEAQLRTVIDTDGLRRFSDELLVAQKFAGPNLESTWHEEGTR